MVALAVQLIDRQTAKFQPGDMDDRYGKRLREVIEHKLAGEEISVPEEEEDRGNVVDLMDALRRSLGEPRKPAASGKRGKSDTSAATKKKGSSKKGLPRKRA